MKYLYLTFFATLLSLNSLAQERIYRCDNNVYTNTLQDPRAQGCKLIKEEQGGLFQAL